MNNLPQFLIPSKDRVAHSKLLASALDGYKPLLSAWLLELTLSYGCYKKSSGKRYILDADDFSDITGISIQDTADKGLSGVEVILVNGKKVKNTDAAVVRVLKRELLDVSKQPLRDDLHFFENINLIGEVLSLSQAERAILCFAAVLSVFQDFKDALSRLRQKSSLHDIGCVIAHLTKQNEADVHLGLSRNSALVTSGLIAINSYSAPLEDRIELLSGLGVLLTQHHRNVEVMIGRFLKKAGSPSLNVRNFPHLAQDAQTLTSYLSKALHDGMLGTNVLLYGVPGTGKTEFVKAIAQELRVDLYEISFSDEDGDPITGVARLNAYNLCQRILTHRENALLMFDEIEDVFPSQGGWRALFGLDAEKNRGASSKAWVNRTLERNGTPAIWITNNANIDPAYLRRFDYSIRFPVPPQKVRMEIARHHLGQFNPAESWLAKIAANEQMTPAQYECAAKVAKISSGDDDAYAQVLVERALDSSATLLGQRRTPSRNVLHTGYDLRFANTNMAMTDIIAGMRKKQQGTFCFYGPAGTGKSELARHIADELGMPCLVRRASDILSMWVGEAEKNIADMFDEARQQQAILVLDEADSFLADRRDAKNRWEVTQVNELLTQMEAFNGIFFCTTNLMEKLDQASLRRFAFKVKFDYLSSDQGWAMFQQEYKRLGGAEGSVAEWEHKVRSIAKLTPGDFAVAARQFSILDVPVTAEEFYRQLLEESRVKGGATGKMGFV